MDKEYPKYAQHGYRRSWTGHSTPSAPLSVSSSPTRPEPTASVSPYHAQERRRSERRTGPRSIPHNGTTCGNTSCDSPDIAADERLCPGPKGIGLCGRCYKRYKVERRRAREENRAVRDDWRNPNRRRRSKSQTLSTERSQKSVLPPSLERGPQDLPYPVTQAHVGRKGRKHRGKSPPPEKHEKESIKLPSPSITLSHREVSPSLHNFPTSSLKEYDWSSAPRKHRSHRERDASRRTRNSHTRRASIYDEVEYHKYSDAEEKMDYHSRLYCCCCTGWSRRRKCVIFGSAALTAIVLIIVIALAVTLSRRDNFKYTPSFAQVNNTAAFAAGGATRKSVNDTSIGVGAGTDTYTYYRGNASSFPSPDRWVTFKDMWEANYDTFRYSCGWLKRGDNNTPQMIQDIYAAIQDRANASLVDQRLILATIIQETNGCPLSPPTTSSGGTRNPGLMQSHNGHTYDPKHSRLSILLMVQDGTQGTEHGWGLVDNLNTYGNPYQAMRGYNSGYIPESGDLSEAAGATACYVSDIANRLTGWVRAKSECPGDEE